MASNPLRSIGQSLRVVGDIIVTAVGNLLLRPTQTATGGGSVYARHAYLGGSIGGLHINDTTTEILTLMANALPATKVVLNGASGVEVFEYDVTTGVLTVISLVAAIDGAVTFGDGRANSGLILPVNAEVRSICGEDFTPLGWRMVTDVNGILRVQILRQSYASYDNSTWIDVSGTGTGPTGMPQVAAASLKGTSSSLGGWNNTSDWSRGDIIRAVVTNNSGNNGWYSLQVFGRRNVKKT